MCQLLLWRLVINIISGVYQQINEYIMFILIVAQSSEEEEASSS